MARCCCRSVGATVNRMGGGGQYTDNHKYIHKSLHTMKSDGDKRYEEE